ncbi:MAG: hypothetical protein V8R75_08915 [Oscillospiraceae bacterium]
MEVQTTEGPYVFDPTHGIYYTTDMATLLTCDDAQAYVCGSPPMDSYYLTNRFFTEAYQVLRAAGRGDVASSQDVVYDETLTPNSIFCVFTEDVEFYRITMSFMEELRVPLEVTCWSVDEDGTKTALEGDLVQDVYDLSYQLKDAATTSEILVEISGRETLPNLALFDIYQ